jgi:DNA-binding MarR family transcriptional regulator
MSIRRTRAYIPNVSYLSVSPWRLIERESDPKRPTVVLRASTISRSFVILPNNNKEVAGLIPDAIPPQADSRSEIAALLHEQFARLTRRLRTLELPHGMTPERLSALSVVEKRGPISVTALAETEMVRPATMSRMITALVEDGLVKRSGDKNDGRGVLVSVTPKGRRTFQRAQEHRLTHFAEAVESLSDEQLVAMRDLASALERLTVLLNK